MSIFAYVVYTINLLRILSCTKQLQMESYIYNIKHCDNSRLAIIDDGAHTIWCKRQKLVQTATDSCV